MIQFYHDVNLTVPNTIASPKRYISPLEGLSGKASVVYLADIYQANLTSAAAAKATVLNLSDTSEFFASGTAVVISNGVSYTITYSGKTPTTLTGVSGLTSAVLIGDIIKPWKIYKTSGNITVSPSGVNLETISVAVGSVLGQYNYPGVIAIFPKTSYDTIVDGSIPVYLLITCAAGDVQEFNNWSLQTGILYVRDKNDTTAITPTEIGQSAVAFMYMNRGNHFLSTVMRLLPTNRQVTTGLPGFILGTYRWRDSTNQNAQVLANTAWDPDIDAIGVDKFISGVARKTDLQLVDLENEDNSIFCRISDGFYFAGPERFYLPSQPVIQFVNAVNSQFTPSGGTPNIGEPIFVGVWSLDQNGFYNKSIDYRYQALGSFDLSANASEYQYVFDRSNNLININKTLPQSTIFLGTVSGLATEYFDMPIYPVDSVVSVYIGRSFGANNVYSSNFVFDSEQGTLTIPAIAGGLKGEPIYAVCNPAIAIVYNSGTDSSRLIDSVDLNPAYAGLSSGYLYIQHRRRKPSNLLLSCDKPIIAIPATKNSIVGLVAYGPIYYDGDYAMLTVTATGTVNNEPISGALLQAVVGSDWAGTINYKDPSVETVTVETGADGKANLLYKPDENYGYTIPTAAANTGAGLATTTYTNDTVVLPVAIGIDRVYSSSEGWLVRLYAVKSGDPTYGLVNGDPTKGQIPFQTVGTPGTLSYSTNGEKVLVSTGTIPIYPIDALDASGHSYTSTSFNGDVSKLVYSSSLTIDAQTAAFFVTVIQRVTIQMQVSSTDVISNTILLEMGLLDRLASPWLILNDATQGRLNQYRLGR